ncbi:tetratricopeptide repeat protein [Novosphingobium mangrovi (ex Huang et al. 2023)]|uniref:SPOR domain-containing protein n=1 Tax=Novosphingobium mangrovi (ex Huang et al. 2023) TaxID=2976432 RepID=A0ABT2I5X5_9SPHN|nr:tetratricopeptide repeat protein [Novosphingobium mangrovi (ex Huang et al. 2023)]MCT2400214.1 SPOR domain-containing protein [Novosphingobium mangrovi (ex Huang et al. 2023)]
MQVEVGVLRLLAGAAWTGAALLPVNVLAQAAPVISQPVVQALPDPHVQSLNAALAKLGRDPHNVDALIDAGDAAGNLGDFDAAIGFYRRADEVSPDNPRVQAGLGRAFVMNGDPVSAIPYFDAAEKVGAAPAKIAADRGLAYDLVGNNATAQRYYAVALAGDDSEEVRMRLALSQAIGGDRTSAETTLMPLLRKQNKPGWRTRAFALAIDGDTKQAVEITQAMLPEQLAQNVVPYLRYMPRLTKAQQAAAANLGRFPRASEIGRDDPRIAAYSPPRVAAADAGLVPKGDAFGGSRNAKSSKAEKTSSKRTRGDAGKSDTSGRAKAVRTAALAANDPDRVAPPEPRPAIDSTGELPPLRKSAELPPVASAPAAKTVSPPSAAPAPSPRPTPAPPPREAAGIGPAVARGEPATSPPPAPARKVPAPGFDLGNLSRSQSGETVATPPVPATPKPATPKPATPRPAPPEPSMAEAFADLGKPVLKAGPASGAVDIRKIEPARPAPKVEEKPKKPAHPSRIWVQIGVGRNKNAIAFDWRRYVKQAPKLFKGREAYISDLGRTNRILAGPFETRKAANAFIADLKEAGIDGALPWISPAGQVVDTLPVK